MRPISKQKLVWMQKFVKEVSFKFICQFDLVRIVALHHMCMTNRQITGCLKSLRTIGKLKLCSQADWSIPEQQQTNVFLAKIPKDSINKDHKNGGYIPHCKEQETLEHFRIV